MEPVNHLDVFLYRDYRKYLSDMYWVRKSEYGFSYRAFARRARLGAPNYLQLVTTGRRNLSPPMASRFADAMGLRDKAASYFCDLVAFNQATVTEERERCHLRLLSYQEHRQAFKLDADHAAYHSEWYIPAVRELATTVGFQEDPGWISRVLRPRISRRQAARAMDVLVRLGFLVQDETGRWFQPEQLLSIDDDCSEGLNLARYHRMMLRRASEAIDTSPREARELGALTLAVDERLFQQMKDRVRAFREQLLQESLSLVTKPNRVIQVNFQLFPLSERTGELP